MPTTAIAPGYCPAGMLPQYCTMTAIPCSVSIAGCIQQAQLNGRFSAVGCVPGDLACYYNQRQLTMIGCPPGPMQGACTQNYFQQRQQQSVMQGVMIGAGAGLAAGMLMKAMSGGGGMSSSSRAPATRYPDDSFRADSSNSVQPNSMRTSSYSRGNDDSVPSGSGIVGSSSLDACGAPPDSVNKALQEALHFKNACSVTRQVVTDSKKIVINDYSKMPAEMYIFSSDGKKCFGKTAVSYGNGVNHVTGQRCTDGSGKPLPCSEDGCHTTPPGFHLTAQHDGGNYNSSNSMSMVGLEGQGSLQRGILIHVASSSSVGAAASWGCSGVNCFQTVQNLVGYNSLVYNYFGSTSLAPSCGDSHGMSAQRNPASCHKDGQRAPPPSRAIPDSNENDAVTEGN